MFTGAATKITFTDIFERESGTQALRRLSRFEGRIIFCRFSVLGTLWGQLRKNTIPQWRSAPLLPTERINVIYLKKLFRLVSR